MASGGSDESMAPGVLTVFDLELLHHYTTSTCYTLSQASAVQAVWRDKVPRLSFGMPPLLHTILAVAALHLARSEPGREEQCLAQAQRHYTIAISTVVPVMPLLASQHCGTLFVFSSMMCIVACARPPDSANFLVLFEHGHISEWIRLVRGIKAVLDLGSDEFTTGPLAPIFVNGAFLAAARHDPSVLEQGRLYLWGVAKLVTKHCAHEPALLAIYRDALDELARTMAVVMKSDRQHLPPEPGLIFAWLLEVSDEYLNLLQEGEPLALLIFAYFSIAIRQVEWIWWMEGLSDRLIAQLRSTLHAHHPDWVPHLPSGDLYQI
ncbi:hypothetical protein ASPZODRAFT_132372 [Penicilliopsis zonata CBS 506.65]|uniref:Transcription factor domain-containing protein n=1 Tax=Penicilliopsis zonata CBS 506.65 TaxID=1073090 RepID=A0A1L9SJQ1_9EURO|nr:hypothetical protein ASPZODRAFT_132372 [Penicilliopsis zonata CBS 506.65]OJJ47385.1 hypothetical protein ASPZODRAFT_132372 [Penicilliopsis zonata CBS 506.65]